MVPTIGIRSACQSTSMPIIQRLSEPKVSLKGVAPENSLSTLGR